MTEKKTERKNIYVCQLCGGRIITIDIDEGVTPFMIECKATIGCQGYMYSSFYRVDKSLEPEFEWYRPESLESYPEEHRALMKDHIDNGGLDIRKING